MQFFKSLISEFKHLKPLRWKHGQKGTEYATNKIDKNLAMLLYSKKMKYGLQPYMLQKHRFKRMHVTKLSCVRATRVETTSLTREIAVSNKQ